VHVKQLRVAQDSPGRGDAGRDAASRQVGLLAGEGAHVLAGRVGRHRGVHLGDALGDRGRVGHSRAPVALCSPVAERRRGDALHYVSVTPRRPLTCAGLAGMPRVCPGTPDPVPPKNSIVSLTCLFSNVTGAAMVG
jgi:hypothetical protein